MATGYPSSCRDHQLFLLLLCFNPAQNLICCPFCRRNGIQVPFFFFYVELCPTFEHPCNLSLHLVMEYRLLL
jgi:hypothetical protein